MKKNYDVAVIGAGPAGLSAAIEAKKAGAETLIIERGNEAGGILPQCIHNGFGSVIFKKDLPGPAYAREFINWSREMNIDTLFDTMALDITPGRKIYAANSKEGFMEIDARAIVLAMGCRERTRSQIKLPGTRPAGVYTAGMVQRLVNIEGLMPGKEFVILGSGDIGMIMARRLTLEGARVIKVVELLPYLTGLRRNYVQCLLDFSIPLELSTTINSINGKKRVESVETVKTGPDLKPIPGTEEIIPCDSLLLSVGLIPENELSKKAGVKIDPLTGGPFIDDNMSTNIPGIFAAGNVVTIYDLADYVSMAGAKAGISAAAFAANKAENPAGFIKIIPGEGVRSAVPQKINIPVKDAGGPRIEIRALREFSSPAAVEIKDGDTVLFSKKEPYIRPAEMITLNTKPELFAAGICGSKKLSINITPLAGKG